MAKQGGGITDKQVDLLKEANRLADAYNLTMAERVSLEEEILNKSIDSKKALEAAAKATEKLYDASEAKLRVDRNRVALEQEIHDLAYDTLQASKDIVKEGANIYTHTRDQAKLQIQDLQTRKSQVEQLIRSNQLTDQQKSALQGTLEHLSQQQAIYDRIVEAHETTADAAANLNTAYGVANDQAEKLASNIDSMFSNMPFGGAFQKIFGLDETSDKLKSGINAGFSEMTNHIAQGGSRMGALAKGMGGFVKQLGGASGLVKMLGAGLAGMAASWILSGIEITGSLERMHAQMEEVKEATGMTGVAAKNLIKEVRESDAYHNALLSTSKDILAVQQEMISTFGPMGKLSQETAANVSETAKSFGYSTKTAGELQAVLQQTGMGSEEAAKMQLEIATEATKNYVNAAVVAEDIAKNSKLTTKYLAGNAKGLKEAAIQAAKMGLSLKDMVDIADGLLNIEDSLTAQYEFQALSGTQINLDKARQLALDGKIADAAGEVSDQLKSQGIDYAKFSKMKKFEKEALAKATGMELDSLDKMLAMDKMRGKLTEDEMAKAMNLGLSAEELQKMDAQTLKGKLAQADVLEQQKKKQEELQNQIDQKMLPIELKLAEIKLKLLQAVTGLADAWANLGTPIKVVIGLLAAGLAIYMLWRGVQTFLQNRQIAAMEREKKMNELAEYKNQKALQQKSITDQTAASQQKVAAGANQTANNIQQGANASQQLANGARQVDSNLKGAAKDAQVLEKELRDAGAAAASIQPGAAGPQKQGLLGRMGGALGNLGSGIGGMMGSVGGMMGGAGGMMGMLGAGALMGGMGGGMMGGIMGVGDLAVNPNGGPIVASPKEGGIYQGTKNDGVSMSPSHGKTDGGGGGAAIDYEKLGAAVASAIAANPPQVNMDGKKVSQSVSANQSYDRGVK